MTRVWRVRDRTTFIELRRHGRRARHGPISVTWLSGPDTDPPRVAYAIGRRTGRAVARNRLRRRLRALVADMAADLRPGAYLVGASAEANELSPADLRGALSAAIGAAHGANR